MPAPLLSLPPWLETPAIPPLAPIQSFFQGFGAGQQAAAAQANREQQAEQFGSELALRQAKAAQDYQQTQQEQQLRAQQLAAQLLHQRAMEQQAIENNESLKQHRLDLAAQAKVTGERLQQQTLAQQAHWKALEDAAKATVTPVMINLPGRGQAFLNPKTGAIHIPPKEPQPVSTFAEREDVKEINKQIKELEEGPARESEASGLGHPSTWFGGVTSDYEQATNKLAQLKAQKADILKRFRPQEAQVKTGPPNKSDLVKGAVYQTAKGLAEWDGEKFIPR